MSHAVPAQSPSGSRAPAGRPQRRPGCLAAPPAAPAPPRPAGREGSGSPRKFQVRKQGHTFLGEGQGPTAPRPHWCERSSRVTAGKWRPGGEPGRAQGAGLGQGTAARGGDQRKRDKEGTERGLSCALYVSEMCLVSLPPGILQVSTGACLWTRHVCPSLAHLGL